MKAFRWAKAQTGLVSSEKFVLVMLADFYNDEWARAWPSHSRLAAATELSVATVKRAIASLENSGLVIVEAWVVNEGGAMPNRYLLPAHRPEERPAAVQPVLAYAGWSGMEDFSHESARRVPGSNLIVDEESLRPAGVGSP